MPDIVYKEESFEIIGILFEIYNNLGGGFSEIVDKDALEYELKINNIACEREKEYTVHYKDAILNHKFYADFGLPDPIILELKSCDKFVSKHIAQGIKYLKVSNNKLAILANFYNKSLEHKRIVL